MPKSNFFGGLACGWDIDFECFLYVFWADSMCIEQSIVTFNDRTLGSRPLALSQVRVPLSRRRETHGFQAVVEIRTTHDTKREISKVAWNLFKISQNAAKPF